MLGPPLDTARPGPYYVGMTTQLLLPLEATLRLIVTAVIAEADGGRTVVIQTPDQAVRMFVTVVYDGHRPGRVAGGIVRIIGPAGVRQFGGLLAGDLANELAVGDAVGSYLAGLAEKHTGVTLAR